MLVTPALAAACVSVKVKLNESTAIDATNVLRVRIKFLPMSKPFNRSINAERQSQFLCCPLKAKAEIAIRASLEPKLGQRHWAHGARMRNNMKMGALTIFVSMS